MTIEVKVPTLPESVADAVVLTWHKKPGDAVKRDESLVDVETDKVVLEVPAPADGVLSSIAEQEGATVVSDQLLAIMQEGAISESPANVEKTIDSKDDDATAAMISPSAKKMMVENNLDENSVTGTGRDGRVLKEDVINYLSQQQPTDTSKVAASVADKEPVLSSGERIEKRVPMTRLRARIAERLLDAQQSAAILTTFNEVNMKPVMDLRKKYQDKFEKANDVRLGFMSFFIKATVEALKKFPTVNASIDGSDIVYHGFFDMGVAVSSPRGLVVPVIRDVDQMNLAEVEKAINAYVEKAKNNSIGIEEMTGGTFTISNGGVFGSLLSTPILNPPQSAILGMHKIQDRPVVENGEIVIRPIMYLALSYDHRIIDGREAVQFLVTIKDCLEDPARMIIGV